jgi:aspartate/methionine/tyrosine aminotransferase
LPKEYYVQLAKGYAARCDLLLTALREAGFRAFRPRGAYYIMTDISGFGARDDLAFARHLVQEIGVASVPGSSFYSGSNGKQQIRFAFCKQEETLARAIANLHRLHA